MDSSTGPFLRLFRLSPEVRRDESVHLPKTVIALPVNGLQQIVYFLSQISLAFPFDTVMLDTGSTVGDSE